MTRVPSAPVRCLLRFLALVGDGGLRLRSIRALGGDRARSKSEAKQNILFPGRCRTAAAGEAAGRSPGSALVLLNIQGVLFWLQERDRAVASVTSQQEVFGRLRGGCDMVKLARFGRRWSHFKGGRTAFGRQRC